MSNNIFSSSCVKICRILFIECEIHQLAMSTRCIVRREIARLSLHRLVQDGRIHPARIEEVVGKIEKHSGIYETQSWGNENLPGFYNKSILISTELSPLILLGKILTIEKELGRERKKKWESREIDIDILFFNSEVIEDQNLNIPHPLIQERMFSLVPSAEILPDYIHPVIGCSLTELIIKCKDQLKVSKISN